MKILIFVLFIFQVSSYCFASCPKMPVPQNPNLKGNRYYKPAKFFNAKSYIDNKDRTCTFTYPTTRTNTDKIIKAIFFGAPLETGDLYYKRVCELYGMKNFKKVTFEGSSEDVACPGQEIAWDGHLYRDISNMSDSREGMGCTYIHQITCHW